MPRSRRAAVAERPMASSSHGYRARVFLEGIPEANQFLVFPTESPALTRTRSTKTTDGRVHRQFPADARRAPHGQQKQLVAGKHRCIPPGGGVATKALSTFAVAGDEDAQARFDVPKARGLGQGNPGEFQCLFLDRQGIHVDIPPILWLAWINRRAVRWCRSWGMPR